MKTEPISIDGVAGPVVISTNAFWGRPTVTVGGVPAPRAGRRRYTFPAAGGRVVEATVRTGFGDPYPTVEVGGVAHRTGPTVPVVLRVLTLLPILLVCVGGLLGGLIGVLGILANLAFTRTRTPPVVKALGMIGVSVVALLVFLAVAAAVTGSTGQS